jgi:hypothetical protein
LQLRLDTGKSDAVRSGVYKHKISHFVCDAKLFHYFPHFTSHILFVLYCKNFNESVVLLSLFDNPMNHDFK